MVRGRNIVCWVRPGGGGADARWIVSFGARDGKLLSQKRMFPRLMRD